jgi:hypothetical protein
MVAFLGGVAGSSEVDPLAAMPEYYKFIATSAEKQ